MIAESTWFVDDPSATNPASGRVHTAAGWIVPPGASFSINQKSDCNCFYQISSRSGGVVSRLSLTICKSPSIIISRKSFMKVESQITWDPAHEHFHQKLVCFNLSKSVHKILSATLLSLFISARIHHDNFRLLLLPPGNLSARIVAPIAGQLPEYARHGGQHKERHQQVAAAGSLATQYLSSIKAVSVDVKRDFIIFYLAWIKKFQTFSLMCDCNCERLNTGTIELQPASQPASQREGARQTDT